MLIKNSFSYQSDSHKKADDNAISLNSSEVYTNNSKEGRKLKRLLFLSIKTSEVL